jgi:uncharacterized protein
MLIETLIICAILGALLGVIGGLFGIGGGIIAIPALGLLFDMNQQAAEGTALIMIVCNVFLGFWKYRQRSAIDWRLAGTLAFSASIVTYITARWAVHMPTSTLRDAFALFLVVMAMYLAVRIIQSRVGQADKAGYANRRAPLSWPWSAAVGVTGGALSGLFGVGGATIAPPALTHFFGINQSAAQGLALALIAPGTVIALFVYARAGAVDWNIGLALALGGLTTVSLGVAAAHRLPERKLRLLFCGFLVFTAGALYVHG